MVQHWTTAGIAPYCRPQANPGRCNLQEEKQQHCTCCSTCCPPTTAITFQGITCSCGSIHQVASRQHGFWPVHATPSGLILSLILEQCKALRPLYLITFVCFAVSYFQRSRSSEDAHACKACPSRPCSACSET